MTLPSAATQAVLYYAATNAVPCSIEVSTSATYSPVVYAVDATKFSGANSDGLSNIGARQLVVGQKWIGTASITVPVGNASRSGTSIVTVNNVPHPFIVGDYITVADTSSDAYSLPRAKVWFVGSPTSFAYEVVSKATDRNLQALRRITTERAVVVDAKDYEPRPLARVAGQVRASKHLTDPTLLEMSSTSSVGSCLVRGRARPSHSQASDPSRPPVPQQTEKLMDRVTIRLYCLPTRD